MILPFSTKFKDGEPTHFIEKIWHSLEEHNPEMAKLFKFDYENAYENKIGELWDGAMLDDLTPKPHTIREDTKNRWKAGNKIHMVVFNRSKNQFQFTPVLECTSVQKIEIKFPTEYLNDAKVLIDGKTLTREEVQELAWNDGFENLIHFYLFFEKDFTGKIIHWTNLKY